jgi:serine protease inhibitor
MDSQLFVGEQRRLVIKPGFVESAMRKYGCLVANIDPLASTSVSTINSWVSSQTKGLIPT